jgi:hypothetical protein
MAERRSAVMIIADAWWEGPDGSLQKGRACIVNKSISGACVRIEKRLQVGAKLRIESRWDEFSGEAKYCRSDGGGYLVGIQREAGVNADPKQPTKSLPNRDDRQRDEPIPPAQWMPDAVPNWDDKLSQNNLTDDQGVDSARIAHIGADALHNEAIAAVAVEVLPPSAGYRRLLPWRWHRLQRQGVRSRQWREARATPLLKEMGAPKERGSRPMEFNWFGRGKRGVADANENGSANSGDSAETNRAAAAGAAQPTKGRGAAALDGDLTYQNELLSLEEIYIAAGIVSPRRGYTIKKVVEMLHSEHLTALSKEMRRASVMMALDAAGISVDNVLRDAQVRLDAINSYEADQKQLWEAWWARKTEEHGQLKAELEQVRARFMERMKLVQDGVADDRARFGTWLTTVHEEAQSIAEAVELCMKAAPLVPDNLAPTADEATRLKVV